MMKMFFFLLLTLNFAFADEAQKLQALKVKMKSNMEAFCSKGSTAACNVKKQTENPNAKITTVPKKPSPEVAAQMEAAMQKLQACKDHECMMKAAEEHSNIAIKTHSTGCNAGSQDDCFWVEHLKILNEMQKSLKSL